jgi:hypothetical protein
MEELNLENILSAYPIPLSRIDSAPYNVWLDTIECYLITGCACICISSISSQSLRERCPRLLTKLVQRGLKDQEL